MKPRAASFAIRQTRAPVKVGDRMAATKIALRAGDWVEVRSKEEILATLDQNARLEELPFMPQMFQYCGKRFKVFKRAHKTCDTVNGTGGRWVANAVHLELRCDGQAYGGCQAACVIFWKEAWLKPIDANMPNSTASPLRDLSRRDASADEAVCTQEDVWKATCIENHQSDHETRYCCQATQLPYFTTHLAWYDIRQYLEDYRSGNVSLVRMLLGFIYVSYYYGSLASRGRSGRPARWFYDWFQALWGGVPFPRSRGNIPVGQPAPTCDLNLQPGELVRVKSHKEILSTVDTTCFNRGLGFDAEQVPYCGGIYRVKARVNRFIDEKTGKMRNLKTPAVMLEGVYCQSRYSKNRMFCPRAIFSWWREIWLERVPESTPKI